MKWGVETAIFGGQWGACHFAVPPDMAVVAEVHFADMGGGK
jgi:hypothetical protein